MEQNGDFIGGLLQEGVSLAILLIVLTGLYRLLNRFLDMMALHFEKCCGELQRIADGIDSANESAESDN